ncbi:MAG: hypothetical protein OEW60_04180 [Thiovulaceae bacterium]|nr:hypothetical protein [Sulfurimonadaceae bacterium]
MKQHFIFLLFIIFLTKLSAGTSDNKLSEDAKIKRLEQIILQKEEEIEVLLRALKNGEAENHAKLSSQKLDFNKVQVITPTKVVLKPEGLSEAAIAEIDKSSQVYKEFVPIKEEELKSEPAPIIERRLVRKEIPVAVEQKMPKVPKVEQEEEPEPEPEPEPVVEVEVPVEVEAPKPVRKYVSIQAELKYMQPSKFKVKMIAPVYKKLGGELFEEWDVGKTFTSNRYRGKWIMVTGIITDKGWVKSPADLWIQESFVQKVQ